MQILPFILFALIVIYELVPWSYFMSDKIEIDWHPGTKTKQIAWWRQKARNGEIVCFSEAFDNLSNARRAAKRQAKKLGGAKVVDLTKPAK